MSPQHILLVTAESINRRVLRDTLISEACAILEARNCEEALEEIQAGPIALVLVDVNLPGTDGFEACKKIRRTSDVPVILIGISSMERDRRRIQESGANDYITMPFVRDQLLARIRAALRMAPAELRDTNFESSSFTCDFTFRRVIVNNQIVRLTPKEMELLRHLVLNQGRPISHGKLLEVLWGSNDLHRIGDLRVFINQLRKKIDPHLRCPRYSHIQTDNFIGYHFEPNPEKPTAPRRSSRAKPADFQDG